MSLLNAESLRRAAVDAIVAVVRREPDPWRQARLMGLARKRREHEGLRSLAGDLVCQPETRWAAGEILADPSPMPPAEGPLWIETVTGLALARIPPGTFLMGTDDPRGRRRPEVEGPAHPVTLTREYWLGRYPVTNGEYRRFLKASPQARSPDCWRDPRVSGAEQPVTGVSWEDAAAYCQWASAATGLRFGLPTEAQWEYACRAGSPGPFACGEKESELREHAWHGEESTGGVNHPVGLKRPNRWGLHDMHGNVWEWCRDWRARYPDEAVVDPAGPARGDERVCRGGSWNYGIRFCRGTHRSRNRPRDRLVVLGFRVAVMPDEPTAA